MKVIRLASAETCEPEQAWKRASLCNQKDISIEHFAKPARHASPRHEHPSAQVLVVLTGKLTITTDTETETLAEGDCVYLPGHEPHAVINPLDVPSTGLDIFVPGRSFDFWLKRMKK